MNYFIYDRAEKKLVGNLGGYTTRKGALDGTHSFSLSYPAHEYVRRVLKCEPGENYRNNLFQYLEDRYEVIEASEISILSPSGTIYTQKLP